MQDKRVIRRLWKLAERLSATAELVRGATMPHHLNLCKSRFMRHLRELIIIRDSWSDSYKPSRKKRQTRPIIGPYDKLTSWDSPFRYGKTR